MTQARRTLTNDRQQRPSWLFTLVSLSLIIGGYFVARYSTQWIETDTTTITQAIETVREQHSIRPGTGAVYPHGFAYQGISVAILSVVGLSPQALQAVVWPLLAAAGLALCAFVFYRQVSGEGRVAALGVLLLLLQPDVLFVTLRGSHEKLDWPLMMVALMLLCWSIGCSTLSLAAIHICLFYLVVFAMIATNVFFASTFIVAVLLSLVLGLIILGLLQRKFALVGDFRRLVYVCLSGGVLVFAFLVYIYLPAMSNIRLLQTILEQVSVLFLNFEARGQPYEYISLGWTSHTAYLGLTAFTWLLIIASFAEWLWRGREILRGHQGIGIAENLDWLLYAGFAIQVAASIVVDFSGALAQNLQLRVFPGFTVLAAVLLARALSRMVSSLRWHVQRRRMVIVGLALLASWFVVASIMKATNEPTLSNKWMFYTKAEDAAVRWVDSRLQYASIWAGIDERLREVFRLKYANESSSRNIYDVHDFDTTDRYILFSERERVRSVRIGIAMPAVLDWDRVYNGGDVYVYRRRPSTPYQR